MYDTVYFKLTTDDVRDVDFLEEIPCFLENCGEHNYDGNISITGNLDCLKVIANRYQIKIKDGSLCKWYLGNNYRAMGRGDTQRAVEKLSDILHLPFDKATVTRLDVGYNIITSYPPEVYFNHLGELRYANRLPQPSGLYYYLYCHQACFYDKNKEQRSKHETIPELYIDRNVLRFEHRYTQRVAKQFKVETVTGAMLSDERFYIDVIDRWLQIYRGIAKINDITLNFQYMKGKQQLHRMGVLSIVERMGGEVNMINHINEAQKRGDLTTKQAYDLRQAVKNACMENEGLIVKSDAITELDKKIMEAVKYYR